MIIYRILGFFVTIICSFLAVNLLFGIAMALANPAVLFYCFLFAGVILYGWFSNRFLATVVIGKKRMSKRQKDMLQVNAIVAFVFVLFCLSSCIAVFAVPDKVEEMLKQFPSEVPPTMENLIMASYILMAISLILLSHIIWTYILIRKNKAYFDA
ncbi:hypothetical protein BH11BAC6_BH11BAC6_16230 [soil metagenome]